MEKAPKSIRQMPQPWMEQSRKNNRREKKSTNKSKGRSHNWGQAWFYLGLVLAFSAGVIAILSWNATHQPNDERALNAAATSFQSAWLDEDLATAESYVHSSERANLKKWSAPRRASLKAGFGAANGRVTEVEILQIEAERAVVRVAFKIGGRKQQVFQNWKLEDGTWRLSFRAINYTEKTAKTKL